ncbi:MAG: alpha/beta hydrolase [Erysipelotrichaceae bacterium]|nr:alpha/beta hydrolase [Erysipelotrichaceae bacterium]
MNIIEYGKENSKIVILIHGGGLSWWNYQEVAEILAKNYHVILPIIDGHAGSDDDFCSIEHFASKLITYIDKECKQKVHVLAGVSLGAQIVVEMLANKPDICEYAIVESALLKPSKWMAKWIKPMLAMSYGLIKQVWFAKLQHRYLRIKDELFDVYYRDTCLITKENMIAFMRANMLYDSKPSIVNTKANVYIVVGDKEPLMMKQSAEKLYNQLENGVFITKKGLYHGEFSLNYAKEYCKLIDNFQEGGLL